MRCEYITLCTAGIQPWCPVYIHAHRGTQQHQHIGSHSPLSSSKDPDLSVSLQAADSLHQARESTSTAAAYPNTGPASCANMSNTTMSSRIVRIAGCISSEPRQTATPVLDAPEVLTSDTSLCRQGHAHCVDNPAGGDVSDVLDPHRAAFQQPSRLSPVDSLHGEGTCARSRIEQPGRYQVLVGFLPGR